MYWVWSRCVSPRSGHVRGTLCHPALEAGMAPVMMRVGRACAGKRISAAGPSSSIHTVTSTPPARPSATVLTPRPSIRTSRQSLRCSGQPDVGGFVATRWAPGGVFSYTVSTPEPGRRLQSPKSRACCPPRSGATPDVMTCWSDSRKRPEHEAAGHQQVRMDHLHRLVRVHSIRMRLEYLRTDDVARQSIYVPGGAKGVKALQKRLTRSNRRIVLS